MNKYTLFLILIVIVAGCGKPGMQVQTTNNFGKVSDFDTTLVTLKTANYKNVKGQLLYLPIYSNIPFHTDTTAHEFDMSAFVAIHNTDLSSSIRIIKVLYFNTQGKLVYDFLKGEVKVLQPLETIDYYVPHEDKSGTGANFLIEWISDKPVNEPLIESITFNLKNYHSAAIISQGKIIREVK